MTGAFALWMMIIAGRLASVQVFQHEWLSEKARQRQDAITRKNPIRGEIVGRNGWVLARDIPATSLFADPHEIGNIEEFAARLAAILGSDAASLASRLREGKASDRMFIWIQRKVSHEQALTSTSLQLKGLHRTEEVKRIYPFSPLGAHVIGFVGIDGYGLTGLERRMNEELMGEPKTVLTTQDAQRRIFRYLEQPGRPGAKIVTTLDEYLQTKVEILLEAAIEEYGLARASAVVLSPQSGEVLALANSPTFDQNNPSETPDDGRVNYATQTVWPAGPLARFLTNALAAEEMRNKSANPKADSAAAARVGGKAVDPDTDSDVERLKRFGFGEKTGIELTGETAGLLRLTGDTHTEVDDVAASIMQMAGAISTVANGGVWLQPHVIKEIIKVDGSVHPAAPARRHVMSERAARAAAVSLKRTFGNGGGWAHGYGKDFDVAGLVVVTGSSRYPVASTSVVVGFAPSENPQFTIVVALAGGATERAAVTRAFARIRNAAFGGYQVSLEGN